MTVTEPLPRKTEKPWGYELLYALTDKYAGKIIFIKKCQRLSLQYHEEKDETIYLFQGQALLEIEASDGQMEKRHLCPGQNVRILPLTKHRIEALEDTLLLEVSTPELADVIRLKDDYGRAGK
jgi:mannose-6-phosphate isomerase-like protein (cupin superfamily)